MLTPPAGELRTLRDAFRVSWSVAAIRMAWQLPGKKAKEALVYANVAGKTALRFAAAWHNHCLFSFCFLAKKDSGGIQ